MREMHFKQRNLYESIEKQMYKTQNFEKRANKCVKYEIRC